MCCALVLLRKRLALGLLRCDTANARFEIEKAESRIGPFAPSDVPRVAGLGKAYASCVMEVR